jgi:radical SAM superfamily enzyme YgiQ (UPF0313 family)
MSDGNAFRVVLIKPSKYTAAGDLERFRKGFMPASTLHHMRSMTPPDLDGRPVIVEIIDEYIETDLRYLDHLRPECCSLLALVGVQSHQMHRALDLAALARTNGVRNCIIGGPHAMTCDTTEVQGRGVSFAMAEAELIWPQILRDAIRGELRPAYGTERRWQADLDPPVLIPPQRSLLRRYIIPMLGIYPARGCPYNCSFCSVVKIAGKRIRSQPVETTVLSMVAARKEGVRMVIFTSDNFNKYPQARALLKALIEKDVRMPFFVQCDAQIGHDEELIELLARAGCIQLFVGMESFSRATLHAVRKHHNDPTQYEKIIRLCAKHGIPTHFSNIIGFPEQDENGIFEHLAELRRLRPFMASFYILTPIPGTDQYEEFLAAGLIEDRNLDRADGACLTWRHPHLSAERLEALLYGAYRDFYNMPDMIAKVLRHRWSRNQWWVRGIELGYSLFSRFTASRGLHPMAGGLGRVKRDGIRDYLTLRKKIFGIEQLQLPRSLALLNPSDQYLHPAAAAT